MKKQLLFGMMAAVMSAPTLSFAAAPVKARLTEYLDKPVKEWVSGVKKKNATLADQAKAMGIDKAIAELKLDGAEASGLRTALTGPDGARNLESFAMIQGAAKFAKKQLETDSSNPEILSIKTRSEVLLKTLANSVYSGAKSSSKILGEADFAAAREAVRKIETMPEMILKMDLAEGKVWGEVLARRNELLATGKFSAEESLVQAIMDVKTISKEKALEIVRRIKDCV